MKLGKLLVEKALVVDCELGDEPEDRLASATTMAKAIAKKKASNSKKGRRKIWRSLVAADLTRLKTEIGKLATYVAERKIITREDVSALVISEKTTTVWELADLLAARQPKKALEFLDRLLRDGEEPLSMLGAMAWMYRKLIEASEIKGVCKRLASGTRAWDAAGTGGVSTAKRAQDFETAVAGRFARAAQRGRPAEGQRSRAAHSNGISGGAVDWR